MPHYECTDYEVAHTAHSLSIRLGVAELPLDSLDGLRVLINYAHQTLDSSTLEDSAIQMP